MSLPNSEPLPENINELPPARQRHIRRQPRSASEAERQLLMESLLILTKPTLNYFLLSLLGTIALGSTLFLDDPAVLILSLVLLHFLKPAFGLALLPASGKPAHWLKSLISLLILFVIVFAGGVLAGWLKTDFAPANITLYRFSAPYWIDLSIVCASAVLGVFVLIRKGVLPRLIGVLLSYEILFPLAVAGFSVPLGVSPLFPGALLVSFTHLGLVILLSAITLFILGFAPKKPSGWFLLLLPGILVVGGLLLSLPNIPGFVATKNISSTTFTPTITVLSSNSTRPAATATLAATTQAPTPTASPTMTHTISPSETQTPTQTQTMQPTTFWANVNSQQGIVIRESPTFDAPVAGYLNDGDTIEIFDVVTSAEGSRWYRVTTSDDQDGWLLSSLVNTQTPAP
ncbi:MAG: SH3 domain-containing protein [Brevefilum sp.]